MNAFSTFTAIPDGSLFESKKSSSVTRGRYFRHTILRTAVQRLSAMAILMLLSLGMQAQPKNTQAQMKNTQAQPKNTQVQTKSVSVLGDSYSTFEGFITPRTNHTWYYAKPDRNNTDVSDVRQTWWHRVVTERGWRLCMNNSFSGSTICNRGYHGNDYRDRSFLTRMDNLGCPDIIFIFGATNDSWSGAPVGEYKYDDITEEELYTFRPAMARMLRYIKDRYPSTEIYFLLNDGLREEISTSVKTICEHYGVKCIELNAIDKKSGHPTVKGHSQIAEQVCRAL